MKKSKLLSVLRKMKPEEIDRFGDFLQQHHKKDKTAQRIFQYVRAYRPDFADDNLAADCMYKKVYREPLPLAPPDLRRNKLKTLQNKFSDLMGWLEDFFWHQKISADSLERDLIWSTILMEHEMHPELSKHRVKLKKKIEENTPQDVSGHLKQLIVSYLANHPFPELIQDPDPKLLPDFIVHLDSFYAIIRLKLACEMATRKLVKPDAEANTAGDFQVEHLRALLPFPYIQNNPLVIMYAALLALITDNIERKDKKTNKYQKVEALFRTNIDQIAPEERYAIIVFLQNYAASEIRSGNTTYLIILHNLNVFGLEHGAFKKDGVLSANHYTNIINTACKAGTLDWAWDFAEAYSSHLDPAVQEKIMKLGKAIILFEKKDYAAVISILQGQHFPDTHSEIRSRSMYLRSAWELNQRQEDYILSACLAFEQYLITRDKKHKSDIITATLNFVRILKKMFLGHKNKLKLIAEIKAHELLYFRAWLLEKVNA